MRALVAADCIRNPGTDLAQPHREHANMLRDEAPYFDRNQRPADGGAAIDWGVAIFVAAVIVAGAFAWRRGRKSPLYREMQTRQLVDDGAQRSDGASREALDPTTTREVLRALGAALDLDPRRLRLSDRLHSLWDMQPQAGFHQSATFEAWIKKRYPNAPDHLYAETVGDLIAALQRLPMVR